MAHWFKKFFDSLIESRMKSVQTKIDRLHLHRMTDRELSDIGINRCDINRLVR